MFFRPKKMIGPIIDEDLVAQNDQQDGLINVYIIHFFDGDDRGFSLI